MLLQKMHLLQFRDSDTIFLNFKGHFNSIYTNTFNTYSKSTEDSVQVQNTPNIDL